MSEHDLDECGVCFDRRALALRKRGLPARLVDDLRWCGPLALDQLEALESATDEQIRRIGRLAKVSIEDVPWLLARLTEATAERDALRARIEAVLANPTYDLVSQIRAALTDSTEQATNEAAR